MNQTKTESFIEAFLNTFIGYWLSLAIQLVTYPAFGATFTFKQNIVIGLIFMAFSLGRSYVIRRWCQKHLHRCAHYLAGWCADFECRLIAHWFELWLTFVVSLFVVVGFLTMLN